MPHPSLTHSAKYPFDASDEWWNDDAAEPPPAKDWAHAAARGVLGNLRGRRGIRHELENIDEDIRIEITETLAEIIRVAWKDGA